MGESQPEPSWGEVSGISSSRAGARIGLSSAGGSPPGCSHKETACNRIVDGLCGVTDVMMCPRLVVFWAGQRHGSEPGLSGRSMGRPKAVAPVALWSGPLRMSAAQEEPDLEPGVRELDRSERPDHGWREGRSRGF